MADRGETFTFSLLSSLYEFKLCHLLTSGSCHRLRHFAECRVQLCRCDVMILYLNKKALWKLVRKQFARLVRSGKSLPVSNFDIESVSQLIIAVCLVSKLRIRILANLHYNYSDELTLTTD